MEEKSEKRRVGEGGESWESKGTKVETPDWSVAGGSSVRSVRSVWEESETQRVRQRKSDAVAKVAGFGRNSVTSDKTFFLKISRMWPGDSEAKSTKIVVVLRR